jgi:hypothetical protein
VIIQLTPIIRKLVIRIINYTDFLGPSGKFVSNSTKSACLQITRNRIKKNILGTAPTFSYWS